VILKRSSRALALAAIPNYEATLPGQSPWCQFRRAERKLRDMESAEQPLELILARNLVSIISLAAFLFDVDGAIVYYNDAAEQVIGTRFEERGRMTGAELSAEMGVSDEHGRPVPFDELPLSTALRDGRPGYGRFFIRAEGGLLEIVAGALPLVGPTGNNGALVVVWPVPVEQEG
jgi:PAS domain-containing protein